MKLKKLLALTLAGALAVTAVGCRAKNDASSKDKDDKKLVVGATAVPHAEILEHIKPILKEKGYDLEIKVFDDYTLLNPAVEDGTLDANFFQHIPFLEQCNEGQNLDLDYTVKVHIEPMGVYSDKVNNLDDLENGAEIAVPNDPSNEARALELLEANGLIKLKDVENPTVKDIKENLKNLKLTEVQAEQLPRVLPDVAAAVINTNWALQADLNPIKDAIAIESSESPYANVLAVKKSNKDLEKIKVLSEVLNSEDVKKFIEDKYEGSIIPAF